MKSDSHERPCPDDGTGLLRRQLRPDRALRLGPFRLFFNGRKLLPVARSAGPFHRLLRGFLPGLSTANEVRAVFCPCDQDGMRHQTNLLHNKRNRLIAFDTIQGHHRVHSLGAGVEGSLWAM